MRGPQGVVVYRDACGGELVNEAVVGCGHGLDGTTGLDWYARMVEQGSLVGSIAFVKMTVGLR